jgi:transposase
VQDRRTRTSGVPGDIIVSPCGYCAAGSGDAVGTAADHWPPERLAHLYLCRGLSTYGIAELTGLDRQRVTRMLHRAGVVIRPRGAGRLRPARRRGDPAGLARLMAALYEVCGLSSRQIAEITGLPERTVRDRLHRYGVRARSRGGWNREDRRTVPAETLRDLYGRLGLTADEVGALIGASRQTVLRSAHALGIPVRVGGAVPLSGPEAIELVSALYGDDLIASVLDTHDIPRIPPGGPVWARFPEPIPLSAPLVKDLYWFCGVGLSHIELLTGQPAMTVRGFMRREGIPLRPPGGRTPFLRRWRTGQGAEREITTDLEESSGRANGAAGSLEGRPGQQVGGEQDAAR